MFAEVPELSPGASAPLAMAASIELETVNGILSTVTIPPCPSVVLSLMEEARRDDVDFQRINRLISGDVSLAASMMKTANSPFFALRSKVQSVQQAVAVLGLKNILKVVTGLELQRSLGKGGGVSMERFWERSNLHAAICGCLARRLPGTSVEDAYTFGLFHDCGIPILMQRFPDYKETLMAANHSSLPVPEVEFERHATSHVMVGAMLAHNWQLPEKIVRAIRGHHDLTLLEDEREPAEVRTLIALSLLAEHLAARYLGVAEESEWQLWGEQAFAYLGFDNGELEELYPELLEELGDVIAARG